jgi:hypothetical protein
MVLVDRNRASLGRIKTTKDNKHRNQRRGEFAGGFDAQGSTTIGNRRN